MAGFKSCSSTSGFGDAEGPDFGVSEKITAAELVSLCASIDHHLKKASSASLDPGCHPIDRREHMGRDGVTRSPDVFRLSVRHDHDIISPARRECQIVQYDDRDAPLLHVMSVRNSMRYRSRVSRRRPASRYVHGDAPKIPIAPPHPLRESTCLIDPAAKVAAGTIG